MEDLVTFEIAKKLKEKGFREECYAYWSGSDNYHTIHYNFIQNPAPSRKLTTKDFYKCENWYCERNNYDAPTISQVLKWLREEKIYIVPTFCVDQNDNGYWDFRLISTMDGMLIYDEIKNRYNSYEQAALAGIEYVLNKLI